MIRPFTLPSIILPYATFRVDALPLAESLPYWKPIPAEPFTEAKMTIYRKWYCSCRGKPLELSAVETVEDEPVEPICQRCGASPSSDPRHTVSYRDEDNPAD